MESTITLSGQETKGVHIANYKIIAIEEEQLNRFTDMIHDAHSLKWPGYEKFIREPGNRDVTFLDYLCSGK
jgi:hypothetical protein